jgi:hypothetical protein
MFAPEVYLSAGTIKSRLLDLKAAEDSSMTSTSAE